MRRELALFLLPFAFLCATAAHSEEPTRLGVTWAKGPPSSQALNTAIPHEILESASVIVRLADGSYLVGKQAEGTVPGPDSPGRLIITWPPEAAAKAPNGVELVNGVPVPFVSGFLAPDAVPVVPPEEDVADHLPETLAWLEHLKALDARRMDRGGDIGGTARMGVRLGGKAERTQLAPELAASLESWNGAGALCLHVVAGSPAEAAGLQPGDVIVQYSGLWIDTWQTLLRMATRSEVGREYEVRYLREGEVQTAWVLPVEEQELQVQP